MKDRPAVCVQCGHSGRRLPKPEGSECPRCEGRMVTSCRQWHALDGRKRCLDVLRKPRAWCVDGPNSSSES